MRRTLGMACFACVLAAGLSGSELQSGDSLAFFISATSYASYASDLGLAAYPGALDFTFVSLPVTGGGQFAVELQSLDGSAFAEFPGALSWSDGSMQSSAYAGAISAVYDSLPLPGALSQAIFAGADAELILTYSGPDVAIGLPGSDLGQDLWVSLLGGPLSIGGIVLGAATDSDPDTAEVAEPDSAGLFAAGAGLCCLAWALRRFVHPATTPRCG